MIDKPPLTKTESTVIGTTPGFATPNSIHPSEICSPVASPDPEKMAREEGGENRVPRRHGSASSQPDYMADVNSTAGRGNRIAQKVTINVQNTYPETNCNSPIDSPPSTPCHFERLHHDYPKVTKDNSQITSDHEDALAEIHQLPPEPISQKIVESNIYLVVILIFTLFSIVGDDIMTMLPNTVNTGFYVTWLICFIVFVIDCVLNLIAYRQNYYASIFFPLDFIATLTIIPQFLPLFGVVDVTGTSRFQVSRLGRIAKMVVGLSRIFKLMRLLKMIKTCILKWLGSERPMYEDDEDTPEGIGEKVVSRCGQRMSTLIARNVIVGVLLILAAVMIVDVVTSTKDPKLAVDLAGDLLSKSVNDEKAYNFSVNAIQNYFGSTIIYLKVNGTELINREKTRQDEAKLSYSSDNISLTIDNLDQAQLAGAMQISFTIYLLVLLVIGIYVFVKDARKLFIGPLERMIDALVRMEKNPLMEQASEIRTSKENESTIVMKVWKKLVDSLAEQTAKAIRNAEMLKEAVNTATAITHSIADMDLDSAEGLLHPENPTQMEQALSTIISNLRQFRPYIPQSVFQLQESTDDDAPSSPLRSNPSNNNKEIHNLGMVALEIPVTPQHSNNGDYIPGQPYSTRERRKSSLGKTGETEKTLAEKLRRAAEKGMEHKKATILYVELDSFKDDTIEHSQIQSVQFIETVFACVLEHDGSLLSYSSSHVIATWNAHSPSPQHAITGCRCSVDLMERLSSKHLECTIVVNSGRVLVGHVGTAQYRCLVVSGSLMKTLTLLANLRRQLKCWVLITQAAYEAIQAVMPAYNVDRVQFPGTSANESIPLYELRSKSHDPLAPLGEKYKEAFSAFVQHRYDIAVNKLTDCLFTTGFDFQCARVYKLAQFYSQLESPKLPRPYFRRMIGWEDLENSTNSIQLPEGIKDSVRKRSLVSPIIAPIKKSHADTLRQAIHEATAASPRKEPSLMMREFKETKIKTLEDLDNEDSDDDSQADLGMSVNSKKSNNPDDENAIPVEVVSADHRKFKRGKTLLGKGAYGSVYLGMQEDGGLVAMKLMKLPDMTLSSPAKKGKSKQDNIREAVEEVVAEVGLLSALRNEYIVSYICSAVVDRQLVIITEYVPGGSLFSILTQFGKIQVSSAQRYTRDILRGLLFLHSHNIVHRDIKPHNVLLQIDGQCKLADFGASKQLKEVCDSAKGGSALGTPLYMAPEQAKGTISKASDIWSVGICLLQLLLGRPPYPESCNVMAFTFMYNLSHGEYTPDIPESGPEALPSHVASFVKSCCQFEPTNRPPAEELLLHEFLM